MGQLKLVALEKDDIEIVSAHLQDAVVKSGEVSWRPSERRLIVPLNRFDWEAAAGGTPQFRRSRAVLRFERVSSCKCRNCSNCSEFEKEQVLNLLAVSFEETDQPAGVVTLMFSGGAALRLEVECLEAELVDLGPSWATECCPEHALDGEIAAQDGGIASAPKQG